MWRPLLLSAVFLGMPVSGLAEVQWKGTGGLGGCRLDEAYITKAESHTFQPGKAVDAEVKPFTKGDPVYAIFTYSCARAVEPVTLSFKQGTLVRETTLTLEKGQHRYLTPTLGAVDGSSFTIAFTTIDGGEMRGSIRLVPSHWRSVKARYH